MENFKCTWIEYEELKPAPQAQQFSAQGPCFISTLPPTPSSAWIILEQMLDIILPQSKYSRLSLWKMQRFTHG